MRATSGYGTLREGSAKSTVTKSIKGAKSKEWSSQQIQPASVPASRPARPLLRQSALEEVVSSGLPRGYETQLCRLLQELRLTR